MKDILLRWLEGWLIFAALIAFTIWANTPPPNAPPEWFATDTRY